jgi:glycosyltransferase involved in cell wall biosynthesis
VSVFDGLRLTLVGPLPPPAGGMANQTRQLAELLHGAGAQVELVQSNAPYRPAWSGRVPVVRAFFRLLPFLWSLWRAAGRSDLFHVMANSGWSWHLFAAPAVRIAALRGVPVVVNYRGGEAATFLAKSHGCVRATLGTAALLVVPSGFLQSVFASHGMPSEVVPNIIDLDRFRPNTQPRPPKAHLVVARNLEPIYDNATAIRAFAAVRRCRPEAQLTVAGTGPELATLQTLAVDLGVADAVRFPGRLDRDAMAALYREADVVLNPSTVDNMPNSVLEALASAVPVVSTNVGGVPYIVQDGMTALLVAPGSPEAMAAATLRLLDNPTLSTALSAAGLKEVRRYTWKSVQGLLAASYSRVLAAGRDTAQRRS